MTSEERKLSAIARGYKMAFEKEYATEIATLRARLEVAEAENVRLRTQAEEMEVHLRNIGKRAKWGENEDQKQLRINCDKIAVHLELARACRAQQENET